MNGAGLIHIGYNFHQLSINAIDEMSKQLNKNTLFLSGNISDEEGWSIYEQETKWNDNNVGIPILYNFLHGTELILKGLIANNGEEFNINHKLSSLIKTLEKCMFPKSEKLISQFNKIISNKTLNTFFENNNWDLDDYHIPFRYPQSIKGQEYTYNQVRGGGEEGLTFYLEIKELALGVKDNIILHNKTRYSPLNPSDGRL